MREAAPLRAPQPILQFWRAGQHFVFRGENLGRPPNRAPRVAPERGGDRGQQLVPQPIARVLHIGIGRVLAKLEAVAGKVAVDFLAPDREQRPSDLQFETGDDAPGDRAHGSEPGRAGAAEEVEVERSPRDRRRDAREAVAGIPALGDAREELVARLARRRFERALRPLLRAFPHVLTLAHAFEFEFLREPQNKSRVVFSPGPQTVIEMANDEPSVTRLHECVQQRHRIAPA